MTDRTQIKGDDGDNRLTGGDLREIIYGYGGDDVLHGRAFGDTLYGGLGQDRMYGGSGNDSLLAFGPDYVDDGGGNLLSGGAGDDFLDGRPGDTFVGGAGDDFVGLLVTNAVHWDLRGRGVEQDDGTSISSAEGGSITVHAANAYIRLGHAGFAIYAEDGATLVGGSGHDDLFGGNSAVLTGGGGHDVLAAQANAWLNGGAGDDSIYAGDGSRVRGGSGADTFVFHAGVSLADNPVVIVDFDASDLVEFVFDADTTTTTTDTFHLVEHFTGHGGELVVSYSAARDRTYVSGDVDGDKVADVVVVLKGDHHDFNQFNGADAQAAGLVV